MAIQRIGQRILTPRNPVDLVTPYNERIILVVFNEESYLAFARYDSRFKDNENYSFVVWGYEINGVPGVRIR